MTADDAVLARLRLGPLPAKECQTLRIAPSTLKTAVWKLRNQGYVIEASRDPEDTRHRNVYTLKP